MNMKNELGQLAIWVYIYKYVQFINCYNQSMTYAAIILPENPKKFEVNTPSQTVQSLSGKLTSAMKQGGAAIKNAIKNPTETMKTLGEYMQDNSDKILNKFSGIAVAQLLANGNVSNQEALDYLFLGFAPAMDKVSLAMGYSGATQMKDAIKNGSINVGSFVNGFCKTLKGLTDFKNELLSKQTTQTQNMIEIDIVLNHGEQYQSETPDRRVQDGINYAEILNNLAEVFSLDCGLQDGRRYSVTDFKSRLTLLRDSKQVFSMKIGEDTVVNLILLDFSPAVIGARSGLDYTLQLKKINVGSIELTPITIQAIPDQLVETQGSGTSTGRGVGGGNVSLPNTTQDPIKQLSQLTKNYNIGATPLMNIARMAGADY